MVRFNGPPLLVTSSAVVVLGAALVACSPSLRMVQRNEARFELCYGADFDRRTRTSTKLGCWRAWVAEHTEGQPPDRIEYARQRVDSLARGESVDALPGMAQAVVGPTYTTAVFSASGVQTGEEGADDDGSASASSPSSQQTSGGESSAATPPASRTEGRRGHREPRPPAPAPEPAPVPALPPPPRPHAPRGDPACGAVCVPRWDACVARCDDRPRGCIEACESEHRTCMRGCFY